MSPILSYIKKLDWTLIAVVLFLVLFGLVSIYSASVGRDDFLNFKKQIVFLVVGFCLMILVSFFDWRNLKSDPYIILVFYVLCLGLLIGLFFFASETRGVKGWYKLGTFAFDPIEPLKIILIILLAKYFSTRHIEIYRIIHIVISGIYVLIPSFLVFLQPDLGSVLVLISLWIGILLISGIKLRHFCILMLCGILILVLGWSTILKDYQKQRLLSFIKPHLSDPLEIGWNQRQSKIAIGSGGWFGQGILNGSQTQNGFLPEVQTDFIFSSIAEETGLIGITVLLFLFSFLIWRIFQIGSRVESNFPRLFASGLSILIFSQFFIHVGMNLGILPIIGISLPFVSYGGSGLLAMFIALGILQNIHIYSS